MAGSLEGKISLVTGAGSGLGRACAINMAREGATVVVSDIDAEGAGQTLSAIKQQGGDGMAVLADTSRSEDVAALIGKIVATYGRLDCACNNAGVGRLGAERVHEYPEDDWDRIMAVNARGVWLCLRHEITQMLEQEGGAIVNMASAAGLVGVARASAYVTSKHAVVGLSKASALEYAGDGIRVNAICPGVVDTPGVRGQIKWLPASVAGFLLRRMASRLMPIGRLGAPREVAESVTWLCSDAASQVSGLAMAADGGHTAR